MIESFCIYSIRNLLDGKQYIGQTRLPKKRWKQHLSLAVQGTAEVRARKSQAARTVWATRNANKVTQ